MSNIRVHNGPLATSPLRAKKCGTDAFSVDIGGNEAFVTFTSDLTGSGTGFQAVWEEVTPVPATCGIPDPSFTVKGRWGAKIIGGEEANKHSLPWQILLIGNGGFCGGSVLSEEWVITAAHCVDGGTASYNVYAGAHDRSIAESTRQVRGVSPSNIFVHPNYRNLDNDIALLRLDSPLTINEYVKPVCLGQESVPAGTQCLTSGWGRTSAGGSTSSQLLQVYLPVVSQSQCYSYLGGSTFTDNMLCAGIPSGATDACNGDSGGPFVCQDSSSGAWVLQGITSWGYGCARPNSPGVWVRVPNYQAWIQGVTGGAGSFV